MKSPTVKARRARAMFHYDALLAEATRRGLPEAFATDLTVHDRRAMAELPPDEPFLWCLRLDGTHLVTPGLPFLVNGSNMGTRLWPAALANAFGESRCFFYWWDGIALTLLADASEAEAKLVEVETQRRVDAQHEAALQDDADFDAELARLTRPARVA